MTFTLSIQRMASPEDCTLIWTDEVAGGLIGPW